MGGSSWPVIILLIIHIFGIGASIGKKDFGFLLFGVTVETALLYWGGWFSVLFR